MKVLQSHCEPRCCWDVRIHIPKYRFPYLAVSKKHKSATRQKFHPCKSPPSPTLQGFWWAAAGALTDHYNNNIIIALKGAIPDFLQSPHSAANCLQHVRSSDPGATVCKSHATHWAFITCKCHVTCHLVRRDSSAIKFDRVKIAFIWASFYWLNH